MNVLCCCSWTGELTARASCPACGRRHPNRVTQVRLEALRAIAANPAVHLEPTIRSTLCKLGLARLVSGRPPPNYSEVHTAPVRRHEVTPAGKLVLAAADRIVAEQTRHDVAASVARHAELDRTMEVMAPTIAAINAGMEKTGNKPSTTNCANYMPRSAGSGHWREWHRGHGCDKDPDQ